MISSGSSAPGLEAGGDLDQQRHDAEPGDGQRHEVVAREHRRAAVEIGDAAPRSSRRMRRARRATSASR